ncbi:hypothetical protein E2K98_04900 [Bacillus salipaludis]|uniref:Uncharacterized protein n=1 Tax=Bacillus salipaludis TaxID=2547811 RepID=A0A4R5VXU7_9BACI|nr:hypothetical protein [Bacillus salipaludis]MDQ6594919.1 hypothetical protein [Bacillus salipaludis]TDK64200.1 hypothetical protein E2K98_04900 [Bacillus salipaludis]
MNNMTKDEMKIVNDHFLMDQQLSMDLQHILNEMSDESNLGLDFNKKEYIFLFVVGIVIPALLMIGGWFL